jgi:hypothetical protein
MRIECDACDGSGKCPDCSGRGRKRAKAEEGTMFGALKSREDASRTRDKEVERRLASLRARGAEPASAAYGALREEHGIWASRKGLLIAKPRRILTDDSSLYDILLEDQERSDAMLAFLREIERRLAEE